MSQSDFHVMFKQAYDAAKDLNEREFNDSFLEKYQIYSNYLSQIFQILDNMPEKPEDVKNAIKNLLAEHKKVEYRLEREKTEIGKKISNKIRKQHIHKKYNSKSIKSALLNKKI
ncbi:hypothetical protein [Seleniivibrio sp.]|uniref:hypothetical protein n=1 Tax=Seleniivibrio sp. TaxID=2898801 RepID=UPI0025D882F0|nr:hypothetical protein [Seleniivibrio sp.]MCD8552978.1 hypothetical protein [Seleniivibrio sp.]